MSRQHIQLRRLAFICFLIALATFSSFDFALHTRPPRSVRSFPLSRHAARSNPVGNIVDNDATDVHEFVELSLGEWRDIGVSRSSISASLDIGQRNDYGCFGITYFSSRIYTWGSEADARSGFPGPLFRSRRYHVLYTLRNITQTLGDRLGNFEAVFCLGDCVVSQKFFNLARHLGDVYPLNPDPLPVFSIVKCQGSMNIPFPIWDEATGLFSSWNSEIDKLIEGAARVPWEERKSQAVFRGGQRTCVLYSNISRQERGRTFYTATPQQPEEAKRCGRTALMYQALRSKENFLFNVSMTSGYPISMFGFDILRDEDQPQMLTTQEHEAFKYIILPEGHCQWANRLRKHLFMGAALIMQVTQCIEPYGLRLEPWVHFIPVDYWFTNLTEAVLWGQNNQEETRRMIDRMHSYARKYVSVKGIFNFTGQLMLEYASLMQYNVTVRDGAREVKEDCLQ